MLVNPGALGMPVNEQTKAQYAFLTYNGEWNPEIISVVTTSSAPPRNSAPPGCWKKAQ